MATQGISGTSVFIVLVGSVLAYSGLKGKGIGTTVKAFLAGEAPGGQPDSGLAISDSVGAPASTAGSSSAGLVGSVSGSGGVIVEAAMSQIGKPYVWNTPTNFGDPNPSSFDCSGLTGWCYAKIGKQLTHFTGTQFAQLKHRAFSDVQPGDCVFYGINGPLSYHVAIYAGNGQVIEAPDVGIPVRIRAVHAGDKDLIQTVGYA